MSDKNKSYTKLDEHLQLVDALSEEFYTQALIATSDVALLTDFTQFFYYDFVAYRFSMLNEEWLIARFWDALRARQAAFDAVLDMTSVLAQVAHHQNGQWEAAVAGVVSAMSIHHQNRPTQFMDSDEISTFCTPDQARELTAQNPWLVTLFLLRLTPSYRDGLEAILRPADKKPAPVPANA